MRLYKVSVSPFEFKQAKNGVGHLIATAALGMSCALVGFNSSQINRLTTQPVHSHDYEVRVITQTKKQCSRCGLEKALGEFYSKGDRVDARCKSCVLIEKRTKRTEVKRTKAHKLRGRVVDLREFTVTATSLREAEPKSVQLALNDWVELILGG